MIPQQIIKEASFQLNAINQGKIDLDKLKNFLARVEGLGSPSPRKQKRIENRLRVENAIK